MLSVKRKTVAVFLLVLVIISAGLGVPSALADTGSYCYNKYGESVPAPESYRFDMVIYGQKDGGFGMADDLAVHNGKLYVLNAKSGKIMIYDEKLNFVGIQPVTLDGKSVSLVDATGMFFFEKDGNTRLFIADTAANRVLCADESGNVYMTVTKPKSELFGQENQFVPSKVLVGADGTIYVICQGVYKGAAAFSESGEFLGFYGSNRMEVTASVLLEYWWKSLMNDVQISRLQNTVPIEYTNFCIDSLGFIYTCTKVTESSTGELKRMNAKGINVLPEKNYGDLQDAWLKSTHLDTAFVDVTMTDDEIIAALDAQRGRVFLYDKDGSLLAVFGNSGNFAGTFRTPSALAAIGRYIYVLDPYKDSITRFVPTEYGEKLLSATSLYQKGMYEDALSDWQEVLRFNSNYEAAYVGIGKALMGAEKYAEAMPYFRKGEDRDGYSQAYEQVRKQQSQKIVVPAIIAFAVIIILICLWSYFLRPKKTEIDLRSCGIPRCFLQTLVHPVNGFSALTARMSRTAEGLVSDAFVFVAFLTAVLVRQATGFVFNPYQTEKLNIWILLFATAGIYIAFVVSNRLICTLFNGNGTTAEIRLVTATSLLPALAAMWIRTAISGYLVADEAAFMTLITVLGVLWSLVMLLSGMSVIHEYNFGQAVASLIFTLLGMAVMAFIGLLVIALYRQIGSFGESILNEISTMRR